MKDIQNLPTSTYSIVEVENGLYRILKDNQPLLNPHGFEVPPIGLMAAKQAVEELKAGADFTQHHSMLSYVYSYGEFLQTPDFLPEQVDIVCNWLDEGVFGDPYLMLFQDSPVKVAVGSYYANNLPVEIRQMSPMQQVAMICFYNCYCSFVLPYLIYTDIVQELADDWSNYDDLKESFLDGVREFEYEQNKEAGCTSKADKKETDAYLQRLSNNIATLVKFMAIDNWSKENDKDLGPITITISHSPIEESNKDLHYTSFMVDDAAADMLKQVLEENDGCLSSKKEDQEQYPLWASIINLHVKNWISLWSDKVPPEGLDDYYWQIDIMPFIIDEISPSTLS